LPSTSWCGRYAATLLVEVQRKALAGGVDPPVTDLAQAPYSRVLRQCICDPGQARRISNGGEAVAVLAERYPRPTCLAGHVFVPVEEDLRAERRMPGHLDRHVAPFRVNQVERVVVDVFGLLLQMMITPLVDHLTFHTVAGALATSTRNAPNVVG
jgi:hypothetical protein